MKVTGKIAAAIMAAVLALSLTACGEDSENISGVNSAVQSTAADSSLNAPESSSSTAKSSTSSLTESSLDTSSAPEPVEEPQPEKIPLTGEELDELFISPNSISFFNTYKEKERAFDYTVSIDDIEMLDFALDSLVRIIETDYADDYEFIVGDVWDEAYYYFKPETAERLIQEHFLPSFSINSMEYTSSPYWNTEKGEFKVFGYDFYRGEIPKENYYLCESGYAVGEYCYVNVVPLAEYPDIRLRENRNLSLIKMSDITSGYFDIPRVQLKFKKYTFKYGENNEYEGYVYALVGFDPVDDRPEWVNTAEQLFKDNDLENAEMIGLAALDKEGYNTPSSRTAGVISTPFGKRIYTYEKNYREGTTTFDYAHVITTFGTRGQNDKINYSMYLSNRQGTGGAANSFHDIDSSTFTCNDVFSGNTYVRELEEGEIVYYDAVNDRAGDRSDVHEESWKLNDKDISETEYNSADVVAYFLDSFKGDGKSALYEFDTLYSCEVTNSITLRDYYEMCRTIAE